jgi:hypothetical protein
MHAHTQRWDVTALVGAGLALWVIAAVFLWRDLDVPLEAFLCVASVGAAVLSMVRVPGRYRWVGPGALLLCAAGGAAWFAATTSPLLIAPLGVTLAATAVGLWRSSVEEKRLRLVLWYALTIATLATSFAVYFHLLTLRFMADDVARRLVLSYAWLAFGVVMVARAVWKGETYGRDAGFAALALTLGKVILYDTTHLGGSLRIVLLLGAGALLIGGAVLVARLPVRGLAGAPQTPPAPPPPPLAGRTARSAARTTQGLASPC